MSDDKKSGKATPVMSSGRQAVEGLARKSGAELTASVPTSGVMCQQGEDWSRGLACYPQKFVRLIGYRDPVARPSSPIRSRPPSCSKIVVLSDTPIG